jgi:acyl dehydratase
MSQLVIKSLAEFEQYIGQELGVSEYLTVTQEMINTFAKATLDHQWIHTDTERAKKESPYGDTIAHGYLTLSLLPYLWYQIVEFQNVKLMVNYGIDEFKFNQPVIVNSEVRVRVKLLSLANLRGITKAQLKATLEIKDNKKYAFQGTITFLYHFNN